MSTPTPTAPDMSQILKQWQDEVNQLCYEVFFNTTAGQRLLFLYEQRFFYAPVAAPNEPVAYARFREGRNDFIRSIRAAASAAMTPKEVTQLNKDIEHGNENV